LQPKKIQELKPKNHELTKTKMMINLFFVIDTKFRLRHMYLIIQGNHTKETIFSIFGSQYINKRQKFYFCPVSSKLNKYNKSISVQSPIFLTHSNVIKNNQIKQKFRL
jgi:hypothetical protein